jgi:hypothetical protein
VANDEQRLRDQLAQFSKPMYSPYDPKTGEGLERPLPTDAEINDETVGPGGDSVHPYGVLLRADHETLADGMCRQARIFARGLADTGMPVMLVSVQHTVRHGEMTYHHAGDTMLHPDVYAQVGDLRNATISRPTVMVYNTILVSAEQMRALMLPDYARAAVGVADAVLARSVVYTPWERSTVDPEVIALLNRCGQVWLQCERNAKAFRDSGLNPELIRLVPNPYLADGPVAQLPARKPERRPGVRFYNIGKWEPRKNQHGLVGAFLCTFKPTDHAALTIKTSYFGAWEGYPPDGRKSVQQWLEDERVKAQGWTVDNIGTRLFVYDEFWRDEDITRLHERNNIYVSASHAEGWDYPSFDAKTADNLLVHVGFGGSEDYADPTDIKIPWTTTAVPKSYNWEKGAQWALPTHEDICKALREAAERELAPRQMRKDFAERYAKETAGALLRDLLLELSRKTDPETAAKLEEAIREHQGQSE